MGKIKAISFLQLNEYFKELQGPEWFQRLKSSLSPADWKQLYEIKYTAIAWMDLPLIVRDLKAKDQVFGKGDWSFSDKILLELAGRQFNGIYKILIHFSGPEKVLKKAPQLWRQFYDTGALQLDNIQDHQAVLRLVDYPDIPEGHEHLLLPYIKRIIELTGGKNVELTHDQCFARKDKCCLTTVRWN